MSQWRNSARLEQASRSAADAARALARQFHLTLVVSIGIGIATGLAVAGFDRTVGAPLEVLARQPVIVTALVPALGLITVRVLTKQLKNPDSATTDAYVRAYHLRDGTLTMSSLWRKILSSAVTLGSGNAFGFEGPSMLIGSTIGSNVEGRLRSRVHGDDAKVLMVAGAAAGVAAIFKAPLTGVIFALEVPYRSDQARRALLPSLAAAGASYVTFVILTGTAPLLPSGGYAPFDLKDLGGGVVVGLVCGILARLGAQAVTAAKHLRFDNWTRVIIGAAGMMTLAPIAMWAFDAPLQLGPSYQAIQWASDAKHSIGLLCGLFAVRAAATWFGAAGGGLGGMFIPLVTQGAVIGSIFERLVNAPNPHLFPTIGIAAFLGAGYRTPLAGVAFVAEATGQPGFIVPAFLAASAAQLVMGNRSFSPYQRRERPPNLAPLRQIPIHEIMSANADTIEAAADLTSVVHTMMSKNRRWAPVVKDSQYIGLIAITDIADIPQEQWGLRRADEIARLNVPPVAATDDINLVAEQMRQAGVGAVAVTNTNAVIGVVTMRDLHNVFVLLDRLDNEAR